MPVIPINANVHVSALKGHQPQKSGQSTGSWDDGTVLSHFTEVWQKAARGYPALTNSLVD